MNFQSNKAIYEQIADRLCDEIMAGTYDADGRVPSVREYAALLQVNTNTAVKSYELLARQEVIYNRRGLGYFVSAQARERIHRQRRDNFLGEVLPAVFREMKLLGIDIGEVDEAWKNRQDSSQPQENTPSSTDNGAGDYGAVVGTEQHTQ